MDRWFLSDDRTVAPHGADLTTEPENHFIRIHRGRSRRVYGALDGPLDHYRQDCFFLDRRRRNVRVHLPGFPLTTETGASSEYAISAQLRSMLQGPCRQFGVRTPHPSLRRNEPGLHSEPRSFPWELASSRPDRSWTLYSPTTF